MRRRPSLRFGRVAFPETSAAAPRRSIPNLNCAGNVSSSLMLGAGVSLRIHPVPRGPIVNEDFFGLRENPFSLTPNPRYIHRTRPANETLGRLTRGILDRKGLILLTGEVGTGKTTLLYTALHVLDVNAAIQ